MNIENKHLPIGRALRDFFLAENAAELKVATQSLFDLQKKSEKGMLPSIGYITKKRKYKYDPER